MWTINYKHGGNAKLRDEPTNTVAPESEGLSSHSREAANGPYSEADESTPHPRSQSP
jgi:hypothetical protein